MHYREPSQARTLARLYTSDHLRKPEKMDGDIREKEYEGEDDQNVVGGRD